MWTILNSWISMKRYLLLLLIFQNVSLAGMESVVKDLCLVPKIGESFYYNLSGSASQSKNEQIKRFVKFSGHVALAAAISYAGTFINVFFHELGHALVLKCFHDMPLSIYLGSTNSIENPVPGIHLIGLNAEAGITKIIQNGSDLVPSTRFACLFVGPILGLCAAGAFHYLLKKQNFLPRLTQELCINYNYKNYIGNISQLVPGRSGSDGDRIAQLLNLIEYDNYGDPVNASIRRILHSLNFWVGNSSLFLVYIKLLVNSYKHYPE